MAKLPQKGWSWIEVLHELYKILHSIPNHLANNILGSMTTIPHPLAKIVFELFHLYNINDIAMYEKLREIEVEAVEMMGEILGCTRCTGMITSGGSEANLAALYLAREHGYNIVFAAPTAHDSVFKAANMLRMEVVPLEIDKSYTISISDLEKKCRERGSGIIVATLGTTGIGTIDPIEEISQIAKECDCVVHIDAAFGGFVAPFLYRDQKLGFQNEAVVSVTMDPHKLGLVPIPAGGLIVRDEDWFKPLIFEAKYMPAGIQIGLLGTRTAGSAIATWAMLKYMGWRGYEEQAKELMNRTRKLIAMLKENNIELVVEPKVPIVCIDIRNENVFKELWNRGFMVYRCGIVEGIRIVVMPHVLEEYLESFVKTLVNLINTFHS